MDDATQKALQALMDISGRAIGQRLKKRIKPDAVVVEVEQKPIIAEAQEEKSEEMSPDDKAALIALYEKYC